VSEFNESALVSLGELADESVEQIGPTDDFFYVDISSIDRESKKIVDAKPLTLSQAPSRAKQVLRTGDVLVSMTRPNLNAVALVPAQLDGAIGSTGFHVLRSRWLHPEFLLCLVQSQHFVDGMSALVQGALYPAVRPKDIAAFTFTFETPAQQTRIVAKLDELLSDLDAGVAELKAAQKKLGQYRQSLLKAAVEGALTAEWRAQNTPAETGAQLLQRILQERRARWEAKQLAKFAEQGKTPPKGWQAKYSEPVQPDTSGLPDLPQGWVWASVDQVLSESLLGLDRGQKLQSKTVGNVSYVKMNNLSMNGDIEIEGLVRIDATDTEIERYQLRVDDILFNTRNSKELVGKIGRISRITGSTVFNNNLMRLRFDGASVPVFACYQMVGPEFRSRMERIKKATTSVAAVYAKDFFPMAFVLPPHAEQIEIVVILEQALAGIADMEQTIARQFKQSAAQRQNILKAAFSGQLVPQDPNDEPASVLLERIRTERAARDTLKMPCRRKAKESV